LLHCVIIQPTDNKEETLEVYRIHTEDTSSKHGLRHNHREELKRKAEGHLVEINESERKLLRYTRRNKKIASN